MTTVKCSQCTTYYDYMLHNRCPTCGSNHLNHITSGSTFITKDSGQVDAFSTGYKRDSAKGKGSYIGLPIFALKRDAELYERGAELRGLNNWQLGAPFMRTLDSVKRHIDQFLMGDKPEEDHLAAARFGLASIMHYQEMIKRGLLPADLDDLPRYTKETE